MSVATLGAPATSAPLVDVAADDGRWTVGELERFFDRALGDVVADSGLPAALESLLGRLEDASVRAAVRSAEGWRPVPWVKTAILAAFRSTDVVRMAGAVESAWDRAAFPVRRFERRDGVRLVPGGSAVRRGAHVASGVVVMPPAYVNVGAFVGTGTLVDSHVLVGSCAQVGEGVHLSAGVQIGGVLEPIGALPVVVEDGAFLGGQCGVYEGVRVESGAVLAPGVQLTASTRLYDLARETVWTGRVPANAVVVPGSRPAPGAFARREGLALYAPVVVKYRDASTDAALALEEALR